MKQKRVNSTQSYEYDIQTLRNEFKLCKINYYFNGEDYRRIWEEIKIMKAPVAHMLLFAGSRIENGKILFAGSFRREIAREKYKHALQKIFGSSVKFEEIGKTLNLPRGSGDEKTNQDTMGIHINGLKISALEWEEDD